MTKWPPLVVLLAPLLIGSCGTSAGTPPADAPSAAGDTRGAGPDELIVDASIQAVAVAPVEERDLPRVLNVAGKVQFDEDRLARILAPLAGRIADLHLKVGDAVQKGQTLFAINSRDAAALLGEHAEVHKDAELAEKTAAMTDDLFAHQAASRLALQQAQNDLAKARARVARADEALHSLGLSTEDDIARFGGRVPIASPLSGTVIERRTTDGQFVQPDGTPLVILADLSRVWVVGDLFERDLAAVAVGATARITTAAYPSEQFHGRVDFISDVIDPATRTAKVRAGVGNGRGRLKPEMFASIVLGTDGRERVVSVPARATFVDAGRTWVYVSPGAGRFTRRLVEVGDDDGGERRVLSGLRAGESIVVEGALLLRQLEQKGFR